jgi:DnaJ-class molecular chaperone
MPKDYYVVLGISKGANLNQIKRAYRKIVKQLHPDLTQSVSSDEFRKAREAYETLIDENKRKRYDAGLEQPKIVTNKPKTQKISKKRTSILHEMNYFKSFADEFFDGFLPGFYDKERRRSPHKDLYYEIVLSLHEARRGGLFPIKLPVIEPCPECSRLQVWDQFFCPACSGHGCIQTQREFSLSIPPNTKHGTKQRISMEDIGLTGVHLNIIVYIDPNLDDL